MHQEKDRASDVLTHSGNRLEFTTDDWEAPIPPNHFTRDCLEGFRPSTPEPYEPQPLPDFPLGGRDDRRPVREPSQEVRVDLGNAVRLGTLKKYLGYDQIVGRSVRLPPRE